MFVCVCGCVCVCVQVKLSSPADDHIHVGDAIYLMHVPTQSVVSAYMSAAQSHEAKQLISNCNVACSKRLQPCPRNVFIVGRYLYVLLLVLAVMMCILCL